MFNSWQRRFASRVLIGLVLFAAFTSFAPCRYSGRSAFLRATGLQAILRADGDHEGEACNCAPGVFGGCTQAAGCAPTTFGCGFMWMMPCIGYAEYPDIWIGYP